VDRQTEQDAVPSLPRPVRSSHVVSSASSASEPRTLVSGPMPCLPRVPSADPIRRGCASLRFPPWLRAVARVSVLREILPQPPSPPHYLAPVRSSHAFNAHVVVSNASS